MKCINCGNENPDNSKFCNECGKLLEDNNGKKSKIIHKGNMHTCPKCGARIDSFAIKCNFCGWEIRDNKPSNAISEFTQKLQMIEENSSKDNKTPKYKQKIDLISSYPIPNNKEDLFEFLILASSNINVERYNDYNEGLGKSQNAIVDAWYSKFEQAYEKIKMSFNAAEEFVMAEQLYKQKLEDIEAIKKKSEKRRVASDRSLNLIWVFLLAMIGLVLVGKYYTEEKPIKDERAKLNAIVREVHEYIQEGDYILARAKAATLVSNYETEKWDKTRTELLNLIDNEINKKTDEGKDSSR